VVKTAVGPPHRGSGTMSRKRGSLILHRLHEAVHAGHHIGILAATGPTPRLLKPWLYAAQRKLVPS
jgi:hypothetical protein